MVLANCLSPGAGLLAQAFQQELQEGGEAAAVSWICASASPTDSC